MSIPSQKEVFLRTYFREFTILLLPRLPPCSHFLRLCHHQCFMKGYVVNVRETLVRWQNNLTNHMITVIYPSLIYRSISEINV